MRLVEPLDTMFAVDTAILALGQVLSGRWSLHALHHI